MSVRSVKSFRQGSTRFVGGDDNELDRFEFLTLFVFFCSRSEPEVWFREDAVSGELGVAFLPRQNSSCMPWLRPLPPSPWAAEYTRWCAHAAIVLRALLNPLLRSICCGAPSMTIFFGVQLDVSHPSTPHKGVHMNSKMQLTLHATRQTPQSRFALGASTVCLADKNPALLCADVVGLRGSMAI